VLLFGREISVGTFIFPFTFVMTDIINEFYGKKGARFITLISAAMVIYTFLILQVAMRVPAAPHTYISQESFVPVFGIGVVLFVSSLTAFLIGQICDIYVYHYLRNITESRHLWLRATGSTAISQLVDTTVINVGLRYGSFSSGAAQDAAEQISLVSIILTSYVTKLCIAVALTPLIYALHAFVHRLLHVDRLTKAEMGD
jgi:uncharacterized integral membrane protein (TIGR00697 family)